MKKIFFINLFVFTIISTEIKSQEKWEAGVFVGVSSYFGDISKVPYNSIGPVIGFVGKRNLLNEIFYLATNIYYLNLNAKNNDNYELQFYNYSFSKNYLDFTAEIEYNFLPFINNNIFHRSTFFTAIGISYLLQFNSMKGDIAIPISIGYKHEILRNIVLTGKFSVKKTFTDKIDGIESPNSNLLNNNDWYSYIGISLTIKFNYGRFCDACFNNDPLKDYLINTFVLD